MAITINASLAKKIPLPDREYASQQASITINGEVGDPSQVAAEAIRLFTLAEAAVDAQLGLLRPSAGPADAGPASSAGSPGPGMSRAPTAGTSRAAPPRSLNGRRSAAPISPAQLSLIDRLVRESRTDPTALAHHYQVEALSQLTCRQASAVIDELKTRSAGGRS